MTLAFPFGCVQSGTFAKNLLENQVGFGIDVLFHNCYFYEYEQVK